MEFRWEEDEGEAERGRRGDHEEVLTSSRETARKEITDGGAPAVVALGSAAAALRARRGWEEVWGEVGLELAFYTAEREGEEPTWPWWRSVLAMNGQ
jgi:hypothetical protein